jgi:arginyl-tRNA synthetase
MNDLKTAVVELVIKGLRELGTEVDDNDPDIIRGISKPPNPSMGEAAFGCFPWARQLRRSPVRIASELEAAILPEVTDSGLIAGVSAAGPYLNFRADTGALAALLLPRAIAGDFGVANEGSGKTVVIDFSSPNVAKPFGIGHLRSTAIGAAIGRLFRALGYNVVGINHIGDWGTQFGKLISAWKHWGEEAKLDDDPIGHLYDLYVRFHREEKEDDELAQEGRDWFKRLEDGDQDARKLWTRFRDESLSEFDRIYDRMGVQFEHTWGEAYYEDKIGPAVERLQEAGILEESEGALVVRVDEFYPNTSPCLIRRSDGASLYATRDVAAVLYRYETFQFDRVLYVTGADQADHFRKVFGVVKRLGLDWGERCLHIPFGRIQGISTRQGTLVFLEDVFDRARELSMELMQDRDMSEAEQLVEAEKIGVGAVIFFDLSKERIKDAQFSWDDILQIQGRTGPGLQYTQVRLKSLWAKYKTRFGELPPMSEIPFDRLLEPEMKSLTVAIGEYGDVLAKAAEAYEPAILSRYLLDLGDTFNSFYSNKNNKIISDDAGLSAARVAICRAVLAVLLDGLAILGVPVPDRM